MKKKLSLVATVFIICSLIIEYNLGKDQSNIENKELINNQKKTLSYYVENDNGTYDLATSSSWPSEGFVFNEQLSKCEQGSIVTWDNNKKVVNVSANISDKCYVYFDKMAKPKITSVEVEKYYSVDNELEIKINYDSEYSIKEAYMSINDESFVKNHSIVNGIFYFKTWLDICKSFNIKVYIVDSENIQSTVYVASNVFATCFPAGTKIYTNIGYKNIEDINVGNLVYSYNEQKEKVELKKVIKKFVHDDTIFYEIKIKNALIKVTPFHRFFVFRDNKYDWISAKDLLLSDRLFDKNKNKIEILDISIKKHNEKVYNFEVSDNHTYFVSSQNILVHNAKEPYACI